MRAVAALVEAATKFNHDFTQHGLHLKVFLSAETFPHLQENYISNTLKYVQSPLYLHWRPKDLIRLVCWRFDNFLKRSKRATIHGDVEWENFPSVRDKVWIPHFGEWITNGSNIREYTFPYVLRHTQLRPRQLIAVCNEIANHSDPLGTSNPTFPPELILSTVRDTEANLATEVLNAYKGTYPHIADIVMALTGLPSIFKGSDLDRVAKRSSRHFPRGDYFPSEFRRLVAELGIVGRVRKITSRGFVMADFEYAMDNRLSLQESDQCVIHPMFYRKLNVQIERKYAVYPFPEQFVADLQEMF